MSNLKLKLIHQKRFRSKLYDQKYLSKNTLVHRIEIQTQIKVQYEINVQAL